MSNRRPLPFLWLAVAGALVAPATRACDLDGLSHGYGPMSALFAGAHRYQSLNGVEVEEAPPAEAATVDAPTEGATRTPPPALPPTPRRSFVAWAKAKPKPVADIAGAEAPATWTRTPASAQPSGAASRPRDTE